MARIRWRALPVVALAGLAIGAVAASPAFADHVTPGEAGKTKVNLYDNTDDGWNVTVGDPDPVIGFVNFRPTVPGDPSHVVVVVKAKDAAPNCTLTIELVTDGTDSDGGLGPDEGHAGTPNVIGTLTTNKRGKGNSGAIKVDVTTLLGTAPSGQFTYAHVDPEDHAGTCTEADSTGVDLNEYGASGFDPALGAPAGAEDLPANIHWLQP